MTPDDKASYLRSISFYTTSMLRQLIYEYKKGQPLSQVLVTTEPPTREELLRRTIRGEL